MTWNPRQDWCKKCWCIFISWEWGAWLTHQTVAVLNCPSSSHTSTTTPLTRPDTDTNYHNTMQGLAWQIYFPFNSIECLKSVRLKSSFQSVIDLEYDMHGIGFVGNIWNILTAFKQTYSNHHDRGISLGWRFFVI